MAKSAFRRSSIHDVWEKQEQLNRELLELLRDYGPHWFTEELDIRLSEALAVSTRLKHQRDQAFWKATRRFRPQAALIDWYKIFSRRNRPNDKLDGTKIQ